MNRNILIGIIVVVVVAFGAWWYFNQSPVPRTENQAVNPQTNAQTATVSQSSQTQTLTAYPPDTTSAEPEMGGPFGTANLTGTATGLDTVTVLLVKRSSWQDQDNGAMVRWAKTSGKDAYFDAIVKWAQEVGSGAYVATVTVTNGTWSSSYKGVNEGTYIAAVYNPSTKALLTTSAVTIAVK